MAIGIVAEYNPFHNGHIKQIKWIKENFPGEKIIVVLTEKITQRGEFAVASFKERAKIAKEFGVDKVLKLSFDETCQAAHIFAFNAVMKLYTKGKINKIVFGSETNDVKKMIEIATILRDKQNEFYELTRKIQKNQKVSFPKACSIALAEISGLNYNMPNDILGFEYVKTIINNNLPIEIFSIERNVGFHSDETNGEYASASLLRKMIYAGEDISQYSPMKFTKTPMNIGNLYLKFQRRVIKWGKDIIKLIPIISEGMENLICKNINMPTYEQFIDACTSKRYTSSRIKRIVAWVLFKKPRNLKKLNSDLSK
ncbi:nucleotidyltransferase [Mycoplasmopsis felifaucium]|uniref:Nucleotidyltransferase n=1 Tax=Mycoplasmopsis felifaucium TaxID=35768 RepID=A0ABZ2RXU9_9BACT